MRTLDLHIKNMVCPRCIWAIERIFKSLDILVKTVQLGHARIEIPDHLDLKVVEHELRQYGFDLIKDYETTTVEEIKISIMEYIEVIGSGHTSLTLSEFVSKKIGKNSSHLSRLFSRCCGQTMENYFIRIRIEKVKEMLDYGELNFSQIAMTYGYSSVHYLSNQFKKITGTTMSDYKLNRLYSRISIDKL